MPSLLLFDDEEDDINKDGELRKMPILEVVGRTPSCKYLSPSRALINVDLPALNSPFIISIRNNNNK